MFCRCAPKRRGKWKALFMDRVRPELLSTLNLWKRFPSITNWLSFKTAKKRRFAAFWEKLRNRREELLSAAAVLSALDLAFAKAEFARHYEATIPRFSEARELVLEEARHPLLERALQAVGRRPVPLNMELRAPQTLMVISGPNTGGKTVTLKTLGAV